MYQDALLFLTGSWAYPAIEMLWRGETHSSMALAGGICLCLINHICCGVLEDNNIFSRCLAGAGIITGVELVLGLVLNCLLGFDIPAGHGPVRAVPGGFPGGTSQENLHEKKTLTFVQACDIINKRQTWRGVRVV